MPTKIGPILGLAAIAILIATACSTTDTPPIEASTDTTLEAPAPSETPAANAGIRVANVNEADEIYANPPADLVILDVRTPEEFDAGHIDGAIMVDFYSPDYADQLAELDPDVPYLLNCRSGNRSGQTRLTLAELGFTDVADVDGGLVNWTEAGSPVTTS